MQTVPRLLFCTLIFPGLVFTGQALGADQARFDTPEFESFEAWYTSASSTTGAFTLQVRPIDGGKAISIVDLIPMADNLILAQRRIDRRTHALDYSAGPNFAWGTEFVVQQMAQGRYDWARVPVGGGEPVRITGELESGHVVSDMFSPTLASLMPMEEGRKFRLPLALPRKNQTVDVEWVEFAVLRRESLSTPAGVDCQCWVIQKAQYDGGHTLIWVDRKPPFVFKRHRDVGGRRELVSELLAFRPLTR